MRAAMRRHRILLLIATLGCEPHLVDPPLPAAATRFDAPAVYSAWWNLTQACSGITAPLGAITWYVVPGEVVPPPEADLQNVAGYWSKASNRIVLASAVKLNGEIVRHEMLHALSRQPGHPRDLFLGKCDGVVHCASECIKDGGPAPSIQLTARHIPPESLQVTVDVEPGTPSVVQNDGFFAVWVTATNARDEPVVVDLPIHSLATFFYALTRPDSSSVQVQQTLREPADLQFAARQRKQHLFDVRAAAGTLPSFPPGSYTAIGWFGVASAQKSFVLNP